jgi:hypothetical protein
VLQLKSSIPIFSLLQQQDPKDDPFCKWVFLRENTHIWVMNLLTSKMGLSNRYSVGGYKYAIKDSFWVWVPNGYPVGDRLRCVLLASWTCGAEEERGREEDQTRPSKSSLTLRWMELEEQTCQLCCGRMDMDPSPVAMPVSPLVVVGPDHVPRVLVHHSFLGSSATLCYHLPGRGGTQVFLFVSHPN